MYTEKAVGPPTYGPNAQQFVHRTIVSRNRPANASKTPSSGLKNREGTGKLISDKNYLALQSGTSKASAAVFAKKSIKIVSR
jgi:hypothetical protein